MWKKFFGKNTKKNQTKNSNNIDASKIPQHIAIIMDGNGRWAQNKGLMRTFGHRAGVGVLKDIVKTASDIGVKHLTVYAFSTENWKRPQDEVDFLMNLFSEYIDKLAEYGISLRKDRITDNTMKGCRFAMALFPCLREGKLMISSKV